MSWQSTALYYSIINEDVSKRLGGLNSAQCVIYSFNLATLKPLQETDRWDEVAKILIDKALCLQKAGADCILIATNTMHLVYPQIQKELTIPVIHIADSVGREAQKNNFTKVGLLGTRFTMEKDFYKNVLSQKYQIETLIPNENERAEIHRIIFQELCLGEIKKESIQIFQKIIENLKERGCQAVILGCTEIPLLFRSEKACLPLLDSTHIHARAATYFAADLQQG